MSSVEGPRLDRFLGSSNLDERLQRLKKFVVEDQGFPLGNNSGIQDWEALYDRTVSAETEANGILEGGPSAIFGRIGKHADAIDPWIDLIPNEFGVCIVKSAFAIILHEARKVEERRQAIFDAFEKVFGVIRNAKSHGIEFRNSSNVSDCTKHLYECVIDTIQALLASTPQKNRGLRFPKTKKEPRDLQDILKPLDIAVEVLRVAIDNCRDATIQSTHRSTMSSLSETKANRVILTRIEGTYRNDMRDIKREIQEIKEMMSQPQQTQLQRGTDQVICRNLAAHLQDTSSSTANEAAPQAVSQWCWLFGILTGSDPQQNLANVDALCLDVVQDVNQDLHLILTQATRLALTSQGQAHSILNYDRFFDWVFQDCSDLLLIEGNIEDAARENVSPTSLFCVNFGSVMMDRDIGDVFLYFFCGLHTGYKDQWAGPSGMLRSLILQLLISILQQKRPELDLPNPDYVYQLAGLKTEALTYLFEDLLGQFDEKATIYCIIDGISRFDVSAHDYAQCILLIVQRFQSMVCERQKGPRLKVLVTVPFRSSWELKRGLPDEFRLSLRQRDANPRVMTERSFRAAFPT